MDEFEKYKAAYRRLKGKKVKSSKYRLCHPCKKAYPKTSEFFYIFTDKYKRECYNCKACKRERKRNLSEKEKLIMNIRNRINQAFTSFSNTGRKQGRNRKLGIDYQEIINHLGSCPGNREDYHIDHRIPLSAFDFDNPVNIAAAFHPYNHQWLSKEENLRKNGMYYFEDFDDYMRIVAPLLNLE